MKTLLIILVVQGINLVLFSILTGSWWPTRSARREVPGTYCGTYLRPLLLPGFPPGRDG